MSQSSLEALWVLLWRAYGGGEMQGCEQVLFARDVGRKWRFDFAWPDQKVAVELEGGTWTAGKHGRGSGIAKDIEKGNAAALLGWQVLRFTGTMLREDGARCVDRVRFLLRQRT